MGDYFILMADIIKSRLYPAETTALGFAEIVQAINEKFEETIYSPLTITLGDEFQGVANSAKSGIEIIIALEEMMIKKGSQFKLRYVFLKGIIETPINKKIAYGMLGKGLSDAREILTLQKKTTKRFYIKDVGPDNLLNKLLILFQSIIDDWSIKDYKLIYELLLNDDYKTVAKKMGKTASLIWKRKKSLKIVEYQTIKSLLLEYAA
jgi:hypothetical protein